jgi:hypothetical protein
MIMYNASHPNQRKGNQPAAISATATVETDKLARVTDLKKRARKPRAKPTPGRSTYDWNTAEAKAKKGVLPNPPDFSAGTHDGYRNRFERIVAMAKRGDLTSLLEDDTADRGSSRHIICRYRAIAITAIQAKRKVQRNDTHGNSTAA